MLYFFVINYRKALQNSVVLQTGKCECKIGFTGAKCEMDCPPNRWGETCQNPCNCPSGTICNPGNGECMKECPPGLNGTNCDQGMLIFLIFPIV